jgi:hypothetical protein
VYTVQSHDVGGMTDGLFHGASWPLNFGAEGECLAGVYWHNQFGRPTPGLAVQVTPLIARWLHTQQVESIRIL